MLKSNRCILVISRFHRAPSRAVLETYADLFYRTTEVERCMNPSFGFEECDFGARMNASRVVLALHVKPGGKEYIKVFTQTIDLNEMKFLARNVWSPDPDCRLQH
jgi:hypothetical protein